MVQQKFDEFKWKEKVEVDYHTKMFYNCGHLTFNWAKDFSYQIDYIKTELQKIHPYGPELLVGKGEGRHRVPQARRRNKPADDF